MEAPKKAKGRLSKLQKEILIYIYNTEKKASKSEYPEFSRGWDGLLKTSKIEITNALRPDLKIPTMEELGIDARHPDIRQVCWKLRFEALANLKNGFKGKIKETWEERVWKKLGLHGRNPTLIPTDEKITQFKSFSNSVYRSVKNLDKKGLIKPTLSEHFTWKLCYRLTGRGRSIASHLLNVGLLKEVE